MFDDYALPSNYGYGDGDASQLGDLARSDTVAGVGGYGAVAAKDASPRTMPERPRMRVVPNEGEYPPAPAIAHPIVLDAGDGMAQYGYGATKSPAELAAESAKQMEAVTPQSGYTPIINMQRALVKRGFSVGPKGPDGQWGDATRTSLSTLQSRNGLPIQDKVDGRTWAVILAPSQADESKALTAFNKAGGESFFSASGITAGLEGLLSALKPPAQGSSFQPGAGAPQQVSGADGAAQQGSGTDWKTYALIGGGVLLVGGLLYIALSKKGD